jgi:hypothetical protein
MTGTNWAIWCFDNATSQEYPEVIISMLELLLLGGYNINEWVRDDWPPPLA